MNRTVETHNEAMKMLEQRHERFVKLYEKNNKMDVDDIIKKLGAKIRWKEAFKSSVNLESFFD